MAKTVEVTMTVKRTFELSEEEAQKTPAELLKEWNDAVLEDPFLFIDAEDVTPDVTVRAL